MTITKADLAQRLVTLIGLNSREAKDLVEAFFEEIADCLEAGREVKLAGFGNFEVRDKRARPGRNPKTGEAFAVSARRVVVFRPSHLFKDAVAAARQETAALSRSERITMAG
jgi:integration host factor subunit alpha